MFYVFRNLLALRPWSFTATFTPVALGSILAYKATEGFSLQVIFLTLVTVLSVHASGNLVNTLYDYQRGVDNKSSDDRTLVGRVLERKDIKTLGMIFYSAGIVGFLGLSYISPARTDHMALLFVCGLLSSFLYTGGLGLKYRALGDFIIFITFGPLLVYFSYLAQAGEVIFVHILLYAIPIGMSSTAILHANNTRDIESDKKAKIVTVAILLGGTGSYIYFLVLLFLPYILFLKAAVYVSKWMIMPVLTIKGAFDIENDFRGKHFEEMPQRVAKQSFMMGLLYLFALIMTQKPYLLSLF